MFEVIFYKDSKGNDYIDERLTSSWSEKVLIEGNVSRENRKDYIDMLAAQIILQSYMDRAVK